MKRLIEIVVMCAIVALMGCGDDGGAESFSEVRTVEPPANLNVDSVTANPHAGLSTPMRPAVADGASLLWSTPPGWIERETSSMRVINLGVEGEDAVECYVTRLGGTGGGIDANLNRWRTQMSLPPYSGEEIDALPTTEILGEQAVKVKMAGDYKGMGAETIQRGFALFGAVAESGGATYFIKMTGPADVLQREQENFDAFCASLSMGESAAMSPASAPGANPHAGLNTASASAEAPFKWTAPSSWTRAPDRPMRDVTFNVNGAECYISTLRGAAGGSVANINRWRSQMGQTEISSTDVDALETITVLGESAPIVEITGAYLGMDGTSTPNAMMLGVVVEDPVQSVFIKMVGPENAVRAERDNFIAFCESLK